MLPAILRFLGGIIPVWLPHGTAIGNRLLKPIYCYLSGDKWQKIDIWGNLRMKVNPCECVGGNLFFSPQLYDRNERLWIQERLESNSVFIDVGANLGTYTLWASKFLSKEGRMLAIEADPQTFCVLQENIALNNIKCQLILENMGVSDVDESLCFYRNKMNAGGNSFFKVSPDDDLEHAVRLRVEPLYEILKRHEIMKIDFLKIDIEGFELKVLTKFFADCANKNVQLFPKHVLVEINEGPRRNDKNYTNGLMDCFVLYGYQIQHSGNNALFILGQT